MAADFDILANPSQNPLSKLQEHYTPILGMQLRLRHAAISATPKEEYIFKELRGKALGWPLDEWLW